MSMQANEEMPSSSNELFNQRIDPIDPKILNQKLKPPASMRIKDQVEYACRSIQNQRLQNIYEESTESSDDIIVAAIRQGVQKLRVQMKNRNKKELTSEKDSENITPAKKVNPLKFKIKYAYLKVIEFFKTLPNCNKQF